MKVAADIVNARRDRLAARIATDGYVPLADLCRELGVSAATARRDLSFLESQGRIARVHGGALPPDDKPTQKTESRHASRAATAGIASLFESSGAELLKEALCEMGRRCWTRGYVEGNGGNLSVRLGDYFLCTPTGVSKGFMAPEMICLVDRDGKQVASTGSWQRTSEILTHLAIYNAEPMATAVAHAHPVHATAFAISGLEPPRGLLPEVEIFVGPIVRADYRMPGSPELGEIISRLAPGHQSILMRNHGLICWGANIEDAYFKLEITESYCRTLAVAAQLPGKQTVIPHDELEALLEMKRKMGIPDARFHARGDP